MNISEKLFNMKKIIFAFFFLLSPFSPYGNTDNQLILSKNDTNKITEIMSKYVDGVKYELEFFVCFTFTVDNSNWFL